jgi:chemotaxis protein methyltransferase CheR
VNDAECAAFLQWALPRLDLRWPGFRKVHGQVCKRLRRRLRELHLDDLAAYRARLAADPAEWRALDECCHITISRFFRDRHVFDVLRRRVLPDIAARAGREAREARFWSAGCASGEEPYTLKILWECEVARAFPGVSLAITATDIDAAMLARALEGCFRATSLRELPKALVDQAFDRINSLFCVRAPYRRGIAFVHQDLRSELPADLFDLVLCRNVAFTYFAPALQERVLAQLVGRLRSNGYLVIGSDERLPADHPALSPLGGVEAIFEKTAAPAS